MSIPWETLLELSLLGLCAVALPFIPAARTLLRPPQRAPLKETMLSPQSQCETFRHLVLRQFGHLLVLARTKGSISGETENKRPYLILGIDKHLASEIPPDAQHIRTLVIAAGHLDIPGELICDREIFAEGKINIGYSSMVKCVLSPRDIAVSSRARVTRWVRSDRRLDIAESAWVRGWANAGVEMTLARRARFEHLNAPLISFGRRPENRPPEADIIGRYEPPQSRDGNSKGIRSLSVPNQHVSKGNLIATDSLRIGNACRIIGDLRAGRHLVLGAFSSVEGAIYSDGTITVQEGCRLSGPIVAQNSILVHSGCQIGTPEKPTTLTAPRLKIAEGSVAHGTVWATQLGEVFFEEC